MDSKPYGHPQQHSLNPLAKYSCVVLLSLLLSMAARAADVVPVEVQMPGTQPGEVGNLESPGRCDNCHQSDSPVVTIAHDWRGSMMAHAGRDPLFWATVAIAEQDFDGSGDLCIRCHTMGAWQAGHSTPTDGSALSEAEAVEGVSCDVCHKMTNPDDSEHSGVQNAPFIANNGSEGFYGNSQLSLSGDSAKLGPYTDAVPKHQWQSSQFHRSVDFCGSCHDVSNPVVGDLAPNHGVQQALPAGSFDGQLSTPDNLRPVSGKAAFNNPPYKYGVVERTYSEYKASLLSQTLVSNYPSLPADLQGGAIAVARNAALAAGTNGNYADGSPRYFSCQTCHMAATTGLGANKNGVPERSDLPSHDLTGGNYWLPQVMQYMDSAGTLLLGSGLSSAETAGMNAGVLRAQANLENAAALVLNGNQLKVINLTGHKLISGYPEGRRMWLNLQWRDASDSVIREDGAYGSVQLAFDISGDGQVDSNDSVDTLLDLSGSNTRIYEAHAAITQAWAAKLLAVSADYGSLVVAFDRVTGASTPLATVAALPEGQYMESFHFALNNKVVKDSRIPPYGMDYNASLLRSILPVPGSQYGNPAPGGSFNYWDELNLNPPLGAVSATIRLMYQPTSWEYIQFLYLANNGSIAFLANEGVNILDAWRNTGMATPHVMATIGWTPPDADSDGIPDIADNCPAIANPLQENNDSDSEGDLCDLDDDNDGVSDLDEANFDGDPTYNPATDTDPFNPDTDSDGFNDGIDPLPLLLNSRDGDIAPFGNRDGVITVGDLLVCNQFMLGIKTPSDNDLAHGDINPAVPDGDIDLLDCWQQQLRLLQGP